MKTRNQGFTLVEIMIVVAIIAILAAVAIPNFVKYTKQSKKTACVSNLKQIQTAAEQFRMSSTNMNYTIADLVGSDNYIKVTPTCPRGGQYKEATSTTANPTCSFGTSDGAAYAHEL